VNLQQNNCAKPSVELTQNHRKKSEKNDTYIKISSTKTLQIQFWRKLNDVFDAKNHYYCKCSDFSRSKAKQQQQKLHNHN
jgi:hypothetical protein